MADIPIPDLVENTRSPSDPHTMLRKARSWVVTSAMIAAVAYLAFAALSWRAYDEARREHANALVQMERAQAMMKEIRPLLSPAQAAEMLPHFKPAFDAVDRAAAQVLLFRVASIASTAAAAIFVLIACLAIYFTCTSALALLLGNLLMLILQLPLSDQNVQGPWRQVGFQAGLTVLAIAALLSVHEYRAVVRHEGG